tara:strand:+ start:202 stop:1539 length:1338 start_codon:yes stop_codon:yes gene_type:complete
MKKVRFSTDNFGPWDLDIAPTVYPPREDTKLLCESISKISGGASRAVEIGCGSGVISMALSTMGWNVDAYDINPYAVACSRANIEKLGFSESVNVHEGGIGEDGWQFPDGIGLVVWNLPYLEPPEEGSPMLEPIEEASMTDLGGGGWSAALMDELNDYENPDLIVILLFRIDPISPSTPKDWVSSGWSYRPLEIQRIGDEKLGVFALWKTGLGISEAVAEFCESTMDEAMMLPDSGWQRIVTAEQLSGRGRRGSIWASEPGDMIASWKINRGVTEVSTPGMMQICIGGAISESLNCDLKWPNDIIINNGEKIGGVLIEANTSDAGFRIGVGLNFRPRMVEERICSGWSETIGEIHSGTIFKIVDSCISGLLEELDIIPDPENEILEINAWKALSKSLSRGVGIKHSENDARVVGVNADGFLQLELQGEEIVISGTDSLIWEYPEL